MAENIRPAVLLIVSRLVDASMRPRFLELSARFERWLTEQPGFLSYEVVDGGRTMADRIEWSSIADAERGNVAFAITDISAAFAEIVADYRATLGHVVVNLELWADAENPARPDEM